MRILLLILTLCFCLNANDEQFAKRFVIALTTCYFEHPNIHKQVLLLDYYTKNPKKINKTKLFELGASIGYDIETECGHYQNGILADILESLDNEDAVWFVQLLL